MSDIHNDTEYEVKTIAKVGEGSITFDDGLSFGKPDNVPVYEGQKVRHTHNRRKRMTAPTLISCGCPDFQDGCTKPSCDWFGPIGDERYYVEMEQTVQADGRRLRRSFRALVEQPGLPRVLDTVEAWLRKRGLR